MRGLSRDDVSRLIDSLCSLALHQDVYFIWRPSLSDVDDELVLELAVAARCDFIVTHNIRDFKGCERFGIRAATPKDFLIMIGEVEK